MSKRLLAVFALAALLALAGCQEQQQAPAEPAGPIDHPYGEVYFWLQQSCQDIRLVDHILAVLNPRVAGADTARLRQLAKDLRRERDSRVDDYNLMIAKFGGLHPEHSGLPRHLNTKTPPLPHHCGRE